MDTVITAEHAQMYQFAIIGGSFDSFMGPVHRRAAAMDGHASLVAGVFSRNSEKNKKTGQLWKIEPHRVYDSYHELLQKEKDKLDFVIIATPNDEHIPIIIASVQAGIPVVCDKPLGNNFSIAYSAYRKFEIDKHRCMLTHNYSGYPMVKECASRIASGEIGKIHRVVVRYEQGWLQELLEKSPEIPDIWRLDAKTVGGALALGDIGSHAFHLMSYITGLRITEIFSEIRRGVSNNPLDTDVSMLMRFDEDVLGECSISQCSTGRRNSIQTSIYGSKGSLSWEQDNFERIQVSGLGGSDTYIYRGSSDAPVSSRWSRLPMGHPEGYLCALANLYVEFFRALQADKNNEPHSEFDMPSYEDGLDGLAQIEAAKQSGETNSWAPVRYPHRS